MKKNVSTIIAVIVCVILVFDTIRINRLQSEVNRLQSYLNSEINAVRRDNDSFYTYVQERLEKEADQLAVARWEYGEIDVEKRTAEVLCTIVPKTYDPAATKVSLTCNGTDYDLTYSNNCYTATIPLPLFGRNEITQVSMEDDGTIRTQETGWVIEPRYEVLPVIYAGMGGNASGWPKDGKYLWLPKYSVNINMECKTEYQIRSVELVEILDGKEISRTPVDITPEGQNAYKESLRKSKVAIPETETRAQEVGGSYEAGDIHFIYCLDKAYEVEAGSMLEFFVDVTDGHGLRYRSFVDCLAIGENCQPDDLRMEGKQGYAFAEPVIIFDRDGNTLFEFAPELFR